MNARSLFLALGIAAAAAPALNAQVGGLFELLHERKGQFTSDSFGSAVSGVGDVNLDGYADFLVGAPQSSPGGMYQAGAAFVYSGLDGEELLRVNGALALRNLGAAVSGCGDVNSDGYPDFVVGIPNLAAAYVYSGRNGALITQYFEPLAQSSFFGAAVAGAGDVNGDGVLDIAIGAPEADPGGMPDAGAIYVYTTADAPLLLRVYGLHAGDRMGHALAAAGDVNGDGGDDLLVGAPATSQGTPVAAGSAYLISGRDGSILLHLRGTQQAENLGVAVAGAGDMNGDGVPDLIAGARGTDAGGVVDAGAAFVYSGADGSPIHQLFGATVGGHFGLSVAGGGDADGDRIPDLVVGSPLASSGGMTVNGSAFVYSGFDARPMARLDGTGSWDYLGVSAANAGDVNWDGRADFVVGAPQFDTVFPQEGRAYVGSFDPFLYASANEVSVTAGGTVSFAIDFPSDEAGFDYGLLASVSGYGPTTVFGLQVPLMPDQLFQLMLAGQAPPEVLAPYGTLDGQGNALAGLQIPAGQYLGLAGLTVRFAAISYSLPLGPRRSSAPIHVTATL